MNAKSIIAFLIIGCILALLGYMLLVTDAWKAFIALAGIVACAFMVVWAIETLAGGKMTDEDVTKCSVCGSPVRYGSRHHQCGAAVMALEAEIERVHAKLAKLQDDFAREKREHELTWQRMAKRTDELDAMKALLREVCPDGVRRVSVDIDRRIRAALGDSE